MAIRSMAILTFLMCNAVLTGQILRIDKSHLESDTAGYKTFSADVNYALDNRSLSPKEKLVYTRLSSRIDLLYVTKNQAYILINSIEYFRSSNSTPFSTGYAHFRINFRRRHTVSYETFAQIQYDGVRRMRLRTLAGGGIRITPIDKPTIDVHFGSGLMYEMEKWRGTESDPDSDLTKAMPKISSYTGIEFNLTNHSQFTLWGLNQIGYDSQDEVVRNRYAGEAVLSFKITRRLTWINRFSYFYDVRPIIPINQAYFQLVNGLKIQI